MGIKMEGFKKFLYNIIYPASLIYTVVTAVFYFVSSRLSSDSATKNSATLMLGVLVYAVILAYMLGIFRTKLPYIARALIHYAMVLVSLLILFAMAGSAFSASSVVYILIIFTVLYLIVAVPTLLVLYRRKAKENEAKEYKSSFSGKR